MDTATAASIPKPGPRTSAVTISGAARCLDLPCTSRKGEPGYDTWGKGSAEYVGNMDAWASLTADEALGMYIPLEYADRIVLRGSSSGRKPVFRLLVCLDAKTGKLVWYYQLIHHDIWEYDADSPPVQGEITVDGKRIKAVIAAIRRLLVRV